MVHNQIILGKAKLRLTGCLFHESFFANSLANATIAAAAKKVDDEWKALEEVKEELRIHSAVATSLDRMTAVERELNVLLAAEGAARDAPKIDFNKRAHWNEFSAARKRLLVFGTSHGELVGRLQAQLDSRQRKVHERIEMVAV